MPTVLRSRRASSQQAARRLVPPEQAAHTSRTYGSSSSTTFSLQRCRRSRACGVLACLLLTGPARAVGATNSRNVMATAFVVSSPPAATTTAAASTRACNADARPGGSTGHSLRQVGGWSRRRNLRQRSGTAVMAATTGAAELNGETAAQQSR